MPFEFVDFCHFYFVLIHLELDKYVHTLPQFPRKLYPIPDQNGQSVYRPVFRPKGRKTPPIGVAHTYIAYIKEYPGGLGEGRDQLFCSSWRKWQKCIIYKYICTGFSTELLQFEQNFLFKLYMHTRSMICVFTR